MSESNQYKAPETKLENDLVDIWEDVLGKKPISVGDDFYQLGGHSLLAMKIIAEVEEKMGFILPLSSFPNMTTVQKMAGYLQTQKEWLYLTPLQTKGSKYPLYFVPPSARSSLSFQELADHLGEDQPFYGLEYAGMDGDSDPHKRIEEIAKKNISEIKQLQPYGPYFVGGMCFGGLVAYEMAQQLKKSNQEVAFLGILDSSFPPRQKFSMMTRIHIMLLWINDNILRGKIKFGHRGLARTMETMDANPVVKNRVIKLFKTQTYARLFYYSKPYPGEIVLFTTRRQENAWHTRFWQEATTKEIKVVNIPGSHGRRYVDGELAEDSFLSDSNIDVLSQLFREQLDRAYETISTDDE